MADLSTNAENSGEAAREFDEKIEAEMTERGSDHMESDKKKVVTESCETFVVGDHVYKW